MADGKQRERRGGGVNRNPASGKSPSLPTPARQVEGPFCSSSPAFLGRTMWLLGDGHWAGDSVLKHHTQHADSGGLFPPSD